MNGFCDCADSDQVSLLYALSSSFPGQPQPGRQARSWNFLFNGSTNLADAHGDTILDEPVSPLMGY